ncbi:hypothetical protein OXX79_007238 [Metschnikowia pulcherrima]
MMISPLADTSPLKLDFWRTPKTPQLEAKLLNTVPQFSLHPPPVSKSALGLIPNQNVYKFLVVDDNEINLRIFRRVLKKLFPYSLIDTIQDSTQVDPCALSQYKIVFLDIEMPQVTGVDIANAVRSRTALDNLGLVAVTTKSTPPDMKLYEKCGFDMTIPKPVHRGYSGILRDIEQVLTGRCGDSMCDMAAAMRSAPAPELIPDTDASTALYSTSTSSRPIAQAADTASFTQTGSAYVTSRAAATAAVSELLLSVAQCAPANF